MMRRLLGVLALCAGCLVGRASSQASVFGIRGLGLPGREESARALGLGGAGGLFDGESSVNPAALSTLTGTTSSFTSSGAWRTSTNPAGSLATRDSRFPQFLIGGPVGRTHLSLGLSYSMYTDRDFTVVSDGVAAPRDVPVVVHDTLNSRGGIDDVRLAAGWMVNSHLSVGAGFHFLTGSNRLSSRRFWEDSSYLSPQQTAELSYGATGVSIGALWQPVKSLQLAATFRHDGNMRVQRDSTGVGTVLVPDATTGTVQLPTTLTGGFRYILRHNLAISGEVTSRNWSVSDSGLVSQGGVGARNTFEAGGGLEFIRNKRRPTSLPVRLGLRYTTLPFLLIADPQPKEFDVSMGTGFRFAGDRGGFDLSLEHADRSQGSSYRETSWILTFGISVRPGIGGN